MENVIHWNLPVLLIINNKHTIGCPKYNQDPIYIRTESSSQINSNIFRVSQMWKKSTCHRENEITDVSKTKRGRLFIFHIFIRLQGSQKQFRDKQNNNKSDPPIRRMASRPHQVDASGGPLCSRKSRDLYRNTHSTRPTWRKTTVG